MQVCMFVCATGDLPACVCTPDPVAVTRAGCSLRDHTVVLLLPRGSSVVHVVSGEREREREERSRRARVLVGVNHMVYDTVWVMISFHGNRRSGWHSNCLQTNQITAEPSLAPPAWSPVLCLPPPPPCLVPVLCLAPCAVPAPPCLPPPSGPCAVPGPLCCAH